MNNLKDVRNTVVDVGSALRELFQDTILLSNDDDSIDILDIPIIRLEDLSQLCKLKPKSLIFDYRLTDKIQGDFGIPAETVLPSFLLTLIEAGYSDVLLAFCKHQKVAILQLHQHRELLEAMFAGMSIGPTEPEASLTSTYASSRQHLLSTIDEAAVRHFHLIRN